MRYIHCTTYFVFSKMTTHYFVTILLCVIFIFNCSESAEPKKKIVNSSFIATHQWKRIKDGQAIPRGLNVRINLETGQKEAKLMDSEDDEGNNKKSLIATAQNNEETPSDSPVNVEDLKKILKNIKSDDLNPDPESIERVKQKFKSYEKLKKEFDKLKVEIKSDYEILVSLLEDFKAFNIRTKHMSNGSSEWTKDDDVITALTNFEYLVHQINNAQDFAKLNGFSDVVYKSLNSSNSEIRSEALKLLGSATQSNPNVQIAALESGSINLLIKILTFDENINVKSRSLYALSCLIRRFPLAQLKFIADGGLTAFAKIFDEEKQDFLKLQIRVVTLLHDLLFEREDIKISISNEESKEKTDTEIENLREKLRQYDQINLEQKLVEQDWCKRISDWFLKQNQFKEIITNENLDNSAYSVNFNSDVVVGVIETLYILSDICKNQFQNNHDLVVLLLTLRDVYDELAVVEAKMEGSGSIRDTTNLYGEISIILKMLLDKISVNTKKDEL